MSLNYRLVRRPDMRKDAAEGSKLYYAQVRSLKKLKFEKFCNMVAVRSSAFVGDVKLVIDGILSVMEERLEEGDVIQLGRLGNFRMVAGSKGTENEKDFNVSLFNKARIVFSPRVPCSTRSAKMPNMKRWIPKPSLRLQEVVRTVRKSNSNVSIIRHVKTGIYQTIPLSRPKGGGMFRNQSGRYPCPVGHRNRLGRKYPGKGI